MATLNGPERLHFESNRLLSVNEDEIATKKLSLSSEEDGDSYKQNWGFTLTDLYKLALTFYKDKAGKAVHLSYRDKLKLVAFTKQVTHGKFTPEIYPEVGYLDVIGNDRRQAWLTLGDMSKFSAMAAFVHLLDQVCPLFKPYVEAHKRDLEEKERISRKEEEEKRIKEEENERLRIEEEARQKEQHKLDIQRRQIQEALNQQTYHQFRAYAEEQYPGNPEQQQVLIRQLQEQHYQQYMQQVYQQQLAHQKEQAQQLAAMAERSQEDTSDSDENQPGEASSEGEEREDMPPIAAASMWTRKDIKEFKDSIRKEGGESVIKVGHGETVTVRVPTHQDGTCLFWEFATDNYDIAFGVYFEWTISPSNAVSVHVSDSDEDEDEDEDAETKGDVEKGKNKKEGPPVDEIIPVYRRDCHEEVYAGSHVYPGRGIYLLKFDNSYSLWRSKTLYYRVYYTR